jgi:hypothetical protein
VTACEQGPVPPVNDGAGPCPRLPPPVTQSSVSAVAVEGVGAVVSVTSR